MFINVLVGNASRKTQCLSIFSSASLLRKLSLDRCSRWSTVDSKELNVYQCLQPPPLGIPRTQFLPMLCRSAAPLLKTQCLPMPSAAAPRNRKDSILTNALPVSRAAPKNSMFTDAFSRPSPECAKTHFLSMFWISTSSSIPFPGSDFSWLEPL